jgi:phage recombination protein Bet
MSQLRTVDAAARDPMEGNAMNALTKVDPVAEANLIEVLGNSLYPGAKPESIRMVLAWCRATGRDPMRKPIHIVGMSVKVAQGKYEWRDVLMPGIGTYRTDAARTGEYCGKSEPEFGPDTTMAFGTPGAMIEVTFPLWCRVTVKRLVRGEERSFTAREYFLENYATAGNTTTAPNMMWKKRPYGQLAKVAESQALRMAFPEESGNTNTAEEMEGKSFDGATIEHDVVQMPPLPRPDAVPRAQSGEPARRVQPPQPPPAEVAPPRVEASPEPPKARKQSVTAWLDALQLELDAAEGQAELDAICERDDVKAATEKLNDAAKQRLNDMIASALDRVSGLDTNMEA